MVKSVKTGRIRRLKCEVVDKGDVIMARFPVKGLRRGDLSAGIEGRTIFVRGVRGEETFEGRRRLPFQPQEIFIKKEGESVEMVARREAEDIERVKAEREELSRRVQSLQRDLEFLRRRSEEEKEEVAKKKLAEAALHVISVLDSVERAIKSIDNSAVLEGLNVLKRDIERNLQRMGVEEIDAVGKILDPHVHHAVQSVVNPDLEEETVVEVLQRGYRMGRKVLRPALVVVSRKE